MRPSQGGSRPRPGWARVARAVAGGLVVVVTACGGPSRWDRILAEFTPEVVADARADAAAAGVDPSTRDLVGALESRYRCWVYVNARRALEAGELGPDHPIWRHLEALPARARRRGQPHIEATDRQILDDLRRGDTTRLVAKTGPDSDCGSEDYGYDRPFLRPDVDPLPEE